MLANATAKTPRRFATMRVPFLFIRCGPAPLGVISMDTDDIKIDYLRGNRARDPRKAFMKATIRNCSARRMGDLLELDRPGPAHHPRHGGPAGPTHHVTGSRPARRRGAGRARSRTDDDDDPPCAAVHAGVQLNAWAM
ncbi:hypothetical protein GCM10010245_81980 [Streptomyces spectabilis]|nr:hypothetical protein GCM10010245_81980 [Streptomyces spectabilis]